MIALVKAVIEQSQFLNEQYKFKAKQDFKNWQQKGGEMLKEIEKDPETAHTLNEITEHIENAVHEVRKALNLKLSE